MKIMSIDLGKARTGLALCDKTEFLASPIGTIEEKNSGRLLQQVIAAIQEYGAQMVVVGHPINMDGTHGARAQACQDFAETLSKRVSVPVTLWDERQSTKAAAQHLNTTNIRGKKRKSVIDQVAAVVILENYLAFRKNNPH